MNGIFERIDHVRNNFRDGMISRVEALEEIRLIGLLAGGLKTIYEMEEIREELLSVLKYE